MSLISEHYWEYHAEGGHHVLLYYAGDELCLKNHLIRVRKRLDHFNLDVHIPFDDDYNYLVIVIEPWLSQVYCIRPRSFFLHSESLRQLDQKILHHRCVKRKFSHLICQDYIAHLLPNLTIFIKPLPITALSIGKSFSIEFKVKNGLLSCSPFVTNKIKYKHSPYAIVQLARIAETRNTSYLRRLQYNPRDLCSQDKTRICKALINLFENPFNNLKICVDGIHIHGWDKEDLEAVNTAVRQLLDNSTQPLFTPVLQHVSSITPPLHTLYDIISTILSEEDVLARLERLQALDVLDAEGCEVVFGRLTRLLGSETAAEEALHTALLVPIDKKYFETLHTVRSPHKNAFESLVTNEDEEFPIPIPIQTSKGIEYDESIDMEMFLEEILEHIVLKPIPAAAAAANTDTDYSDNGNNVHMSMLEALSWVESLSVSKCIYLLRMWLLALAASDASVILCLHRIITVPSPTTPLSSPSFPSTSQRSGIQTKSEGMYIGSCVEVDILQTITHSGVCSIQTHSELDLDNENINNSNAIRCAYTLSVLDIGPKPVGKIFQKRAQDPLRSQLANEALNEMI
eukprot:gene4074-8106_t